MIEGDNRTLLVGPGSQSGLHEVTLGLSRFLELVGFRAIMLDRDFDPSEHRAEAARYPWIVALPISVGSSAELLDFAAQDDLRGRLAVVLPAQYRDGYLVSLLQDRYGLKVRACGSVSDDLDQVDRELGKGALIALATVGNKVRSIKDAAALSATAPVPDNVQAREAEMVPASRPLPARAAAGGFFLFAALGVGGVFALVLLGASVAGTVVAALVFVLVLAVLGALVLRSAGLLEEQDLVKIVGQVVQAVPLLAKAVLEGEKPPELPEPTDVIEGEATDVAERIDDAEHLPGDGPPTLPSRE